MRTLELFATLWPTFPHFLQFANDSRLAGIRLNSAMMETSEIGPALAHVAATGGSVPLWFDVKGRQMRIVSVRNDPTRLDCELNHPIRVETPVVVLFKAGEDSAVLERVEDGGRRLIFRGGPAYAVKPGESIHIRHPSLEVGCPIFTPAEREKIALVRAAGTMRYFLSYVETHRDVEEFRDLVGSDAEVMLKIESPRGLAYVEREFRKAPNLTLVAARGDLFVEVDRPHDIIPALRTIIAKDPEACVGSRILLSVVQEPLPAELRAALQWIADERPEAAEVTRVLMRVLHRPVPSCADLCELAWLTGLGYRRMLLCDELCLKGELLSTAVNIFDEFRRAM